MFNIDFGSSNSAQIEAGRFETGEYKNDYSTLYILANQLPRLHDFLKDVREMPIKDFKKIMDDIADLNKEFNKD